MIEIESRGDKPPTLSELAMAMVMDRSGLGHGLRPLERDGIVALVGGQPDRRVRHIVLTTKGHHALRKAKVLWKQAESYVSSVLGTAKLLECASFSQGHEEAPQYTFSRKTGVYGRRIYASAILSIGRRRRNRV